MIETFEDITEPLTDDEKSIIPILIDGFNRHIGKGTAIKAPIIVAKMRELTKTNFSQVRLRKMVNYIRRNGLLPLVATSEGYYVAESKEEIIKQINSLQDRADAILAAKGGLEVYLTQQKFSIRNNLRYPQF